MTQKTPYLQVRNIAKYFGVFPALQDVSFDIYEGEFICFLGPSGCGKTTLLRCISGLDVQTDGAIIQAGTDISDLPVSSRDFGIVFQSYALFPNLTVWQNVCYGLINMKVSRAECERRVGELLELVGLAAHKSKYPGQLSGGEQQRVALIRALATSPGLLLLDEPLSALDAKVRAYLRREIRNLQKSLGVTTIMVTHDQEEAQTMADRVLVMQGGRLEQIGTPREIYDDPATRFIADFIGVMNFLPATVETNGLISVGEAFLACATADRPTGANIDCAFRPEDLILTFDKMEGPNALEATVTYIEHLGSFERLLLRLSGRNTYDVTADIRKGDTVSNLMKPGAQVFLSIDPDKIRLYDVVEDK